MAVMSRTQSNAFYQMAKDSGLDPADFSLTQEQQHFRGEVEVLKHLPTGSRFDISLSGEKLQMSWWPKFTNGGTTFFAQNWPDAYGVARGWLQAVKRDHDAPDLWAEARKERRLSDAAGSVNEDNTPFTSEEIKLLEHSLPEVEAFIESRRALNETEKKTLRSRFKYLLSAAQRGIGRVDWVNIFVGQLVQFVTEGLLDSSAYGTAMSHAWTLLGGIIKGGAKLLGG